ncbi:MAG: hypothetical protein HYZ48_00050 [Chlamydiales bacterium]|nr:hypothetical protein [Chlamydiales bacterium]
MKKFQLLTASFISMGAAALFADAHQGYGATESAVAAQSSGYGQNKQNNQNNQGGQSGQQQDPNSMPMRQITPEVEPKVTHWADPFITAEFIYWKAYEEGLDYATTGVAPATANASRGSVHNPSFGYEPGFKLGFGLKFRHDGWDLYGNWTWLSEFEGNGRANASTNSVVNATWTAPVINVNGPFDVTSFNMDHAHAHWDMKFNSLDLELGRNFYISRFLTLRPHFGFKFGWVNQDYEVKYHTLDGLDAADYHIKMNQDFFGCGLRTGLDTVWYFTKHWGLYGDFAFAALWSRFHSNRKDSYADAATPKFHNLKTHNHFNTMTEVLELGLGFRYDTTFFIGDYAFYLQAGWEEQIWFNQNQYYDLADDVKGNMGMQGLSVKTGIMF